MLELLVRHPARVILAGVAIAGLAGGCAGTVVGAAATAGVAAVQERSVGDAVDDTAISAELGIKLLEDSVGLFNDVDYEVLEGRVLLTGKVEKPESRLKAEEIAWAVKNVREVANAIQVTSEGGIGSFASDVRISNQLRAAMIGDPDILGVNYSLETVSQIVYLIGIAQSQAELDRVIAHARGIRGVKKVESYVRLKDDPRRK